MRWTVVIDCARSAIAKADPARGYFRDVRADDLSAALMRALVERTQLDPRLIDDVIWGCVQQQGEQGFNVARTAALMAGIPPSVPGATVSRNCGSSLQALNQAVHAIAAGAADIMLVGGVEHMHHIPMDKDFDPPPKLFRTWSPATFHMGLIAEYMAVRYKIDRRRQDEFALRSHRLAAEAREKGLFDREIVPIWGRDENGEKRLIAQDQGIRPDTTLEALQALPPAFEPVKGCVTAGNSSQVSVGAAALLVMAEECAQELGYKPMARVLGGAVAGVDPGIMGIGPVPATLKALERVGLTLEQIDVFEINEAFAVQTLAVIDELGIDLDRVNPRGGAIALGHPLGASGARIATTLLHTMRDHGYRYGVATMCIGGGQGIATVFELL